MAQEPHATLLRFYHELIRFRNEYELGSDTSRQVRECGDSVLLLVRNHEKNQLALIFNFARSPVTEDLPELQGMWHKRISSADPAWRGPGDALENDLKLSPASALRLSPQSFVVLESPAPTSEST